MHRILVFILTSLTATAWGQQIIEVLPQSNPEGRTLSMEEVISPSVLSRAPLFHWEDDGSLAEGPARRARERFFSRKGSLYMISEGDTLCIAASEEEGISYGTSVSRNEFGISGGIFPSPDDSAVAFYRKDERAVTRFPLLDISTRTGSLRQIRYPMNGMESERISLGVYDIPSGVTKYLDCNEFGEDRYLTNVSWTADGRGIFVHVLDRSQHHMLLQLYDAASGSLLSTLLSEDNDAWVEPREPLRHFKGEYYIYSSENRDGYASLYMLDVRDGSLKRITDVAADVHFEATDGNYVYYRSAEISPAERHLYRVRVDLGRKTVKIGRPQALTPERGVHSVSFSPDCIRFIDSWSSVSQLPRRVLRRADGTVLRELGAATDALAEYARCELEFGTVKSADGRYDNHYRLFKPLGFDPSRKYPLLVYVYGGPHSQMVTDSYLAGLRMWEMAMAQRGYLVYVQDNRGTDAHGLEYRQAINRRCGVVEMEDQIAGIKALTDRGFVDAGRIGVSGWSYGGFMTISLMTHYPEIFKAGVCGGPVIDWKWYEIMYGERYMDTPETNPEGFEATSLINWADKLAGPLLICQGAIDDTVVWQHSLSFVQKCVEKGILLDYFPYPRSEHNVRGPWRAQMYAKFTDFFEKNL